MKKVPITRIFLMWLLAQLSFANTGGNLFNVVSDSAAIRVSTTIPNHTYIKAGIKINTPGYSIDAQSECTPSANGYCLFSTSDQEQKLITINGNPGTINVTLCLNASNKPLSCQKYTISQSTLHYAYFTNGGDHSVTRCSIGSSTGLLYSCSVMDTGGNLNTPSGIALNENYAYIANYGNVNIILCEVNSSNGELYGCNPTITPPVSLAGPSSIALNNGIAYIEDINNSSVTSCAVDSVSGSLSACDTTSSGFFQPQGGMGFVDNKIYFSNLNAIYSTKCTITTPLPYLIDCNPTGGPFPINNGSGAGANNGYVYITLYYEDIVSRCKADASANGSLINCISTGNNFVTPNGIGFYNQYAYIENNSNDSVSRCEVNPSDGALLNCLPTGSRFSQPQGQIGFY